MILIQKNGNMNMKQTYLLINFLLILFLLPIAEANGENIEFSTDNGDPLGNAYAINMRYFEESVVLQPDGPCNIKTIRIYYSGDEPAKDTIWVCGFPTAGNLWPTQYIWDYNSLIPPIEVEYDGTPGWVDIDVSAMGLRSDGYDKIVIQHRMKPDGPWFTYDSDGRKPMPSSWICDPFRPNPNFYNIQGTIYHNPGGDYLIRLVLEYDFPDGNSSAPPPPPTMVNVTEEMQLNSHRYSSVSDINKDGFDDVLMGGKAFRNKMKYNDTFIRFGTFDGSGSSIGDFNNDGLQDFYALANGTQDFDKRMVVNNDAVYIQDKGLFTKMSNNEVFDLPYPNPAIDFELPSPTDQTDHFNPYATITPMFLDYDGDGWLDLFIANRRIETSGNPELYCPDQLWQNNGDGTFINVRESSGIADGEPFSVYQQGSIGYGYYDCYGAAATDYNQDDLTDIFVANYRLQKDNLYKNNGDGTFTEVGAETGVQGITTISPDYFGHGMGCQWGDFNNDGYPDLCVGNLAHTDSRGAYSNPSLIFRNDGPPDYHFTNVQPEMVLKFHEGNAGVMWLDLNCDGLLDLWHGKYSGGFGSFYLNTGPPNYKLREITWELGAIVNNSWVASKLDYDNDGDLDMLIEGRLFRNDMAREGKWVAFRLIGNPEDKVNMDCFGTRIIAYAGDQKFYRELMGSASGSLCTQNSNELHFGVGNIDVLDSVVVIYSNSKRNVLANIETNGRYIIPYMESAVPSLITSPALVYPKNFSSIENSSPVFDWTELAWAMSYSFSIYQMNEDDDRINLHTETDLTENSYDWSDSGVDQLQDGETYFWNVSAVFEGAIEGEEPVYGHKSTTYVFTVGTPKPLGIQLYMPNDNETDVIPNAEFTWSKAQYQNTYASVKTFYILEIASDPDFNEIIITIEDIETERISSIEGLTSGETHYWRVKAFNSKWESKWSEIYTFTMLALPPQTSLVSPENNEMNVNLRPELSWEEIPNTDMYFIEVSLYDDFSDIFYDITSSKTNVRIIKKHDEGLVYYWRVRGQNDAGFGQWSEVWSYTTEGEIGVKEINFDVENIICSPNPFSEEIEISIPGNIYGNLDISIHDNLGRSIERIYTSQNATGGLYLWKPNNLENGIYLLKVESNEKIYIRKLIYLK